MIVLATLCIISIALVLYYLYWCYYNSIIYFTIFSLFLIFSLIYFIISKRFFLSLSDEKKFEFDVIHIHWVGLGFLPLSTIATLSKKYNVCVTAHDYHLLSGGCHVPMGCEAFNSCSKCPKLSKGIFTPFYTNLIKERPLLFNSFLNIFSSFNS